MQFFKTVLMQPVQIYIGLGERVRMKRSCCLLWNIVGVKWVAKRAEESWGNWGKKQGQDKKAGEKESSNRRRKQTAIKGKRLKCEMSEIWRETNIIPFPSKGDDFLQKARR